MEIEVIISNIKKIMKANKYKYKDLADHLGMSESGVKKLLNAKDFSLNKLTEIAEFFNLSLAELIESSKDEEYITHKLDGEIETFFVNNWDHFCFYWLLVAELTPLETILKDYQLSLEHVEKYLFKLDALNIIQYHSKDKIVVNTPESLQWGKDGPLVKKMLSSWCKNVFEDSIKKNHIDGRRVGLFSVRMSQQTREDFDVEFKKFLMDFTERGTYDRLSGKKEMINFAFTYAYRSSGFPQKGDF